MKIVVGVAVVLLASVGGLALKTRGEASDRWPSSHAAEESRTAVGDRLSGVVPAPDSDPDVSDTTSPTNAHAGSGTPSRIAPAPERRPRVATSQATASRVAAADAERARAARPAPVDTATVPEISEPGLPPVDVDNITTDIDESTRARTDSASQTIDVKPPTFGKPRG